LETPQFCERSTTDDLGDALMTHPEHLGDRRHRQPTAVGPTDRLVAILAEGLAELVDLGPSPRVLLGELCQLGVGTRRFASLPRDPGIVRVIPANRLA
jgi:hypothetical protein